MLMQGDFREENFSTAMTVLKDAGDAAKGDQRGRRGGIVGKRWSFLLILLTSSAAQLCIVFSTVSRSHSRRASQRS